jgi:hypothetical protein
MRSNHLLSAGTIFLLSLVLLACNNPTTAGTNNTDKPDSLLPTTQLVFDKLLGLWQSEDGKNFERWTKNENGTYRSVVYSLKGTDTVWKEQATIYKENDKWIFENKVAGQNDGKTVKFTAASAGESSVLFSNPAHDFPTDINYTVPDANTLNAFIAGPNEKGGKDTIPFNSKRVN